MSNLDKYFADILDTQRDINTHINELSPTTPIYLFEIDLNEIRPTTIEFGGETLFDKGVIRIHNDYNLFNINKGVIYWKGKEDSPKAYYPFPIYGEQFDITSNGTIPTPKIKFSSQFLDDQYNSFYKYIRMRMNQLKDIVGAKVIRRKTFLKYLRGENFAGNVNPFDEYQDTPWVSRDGDSLTIRDNKFVSTNTAKWIVYFFKPILSKSSTVIFSSVRSFDRFNLLDYSNNLNTYLSDGVKDYFNIYPQQSILDQPANNINNFTFGLDVFAFSGNRHGFSKIISNSAYEFKRLNTSNSLKIISNFSGKVFNSLNTGTTINYPAAFSTSNPTNDLVLFASFSPSGIRYKSNVEPEVTIQDISNPGYPVPLTQFNLNNISNSNAEIIVNAPLSGEYDINYLIIETGTYTGLNNDTKEIYGLDIMKKTFNFGLSTSGSTGINFNYNFNQTPPKILIHSNGSGNKFDFKYNLSNITNTGCIFNISGDSALGQHRVSILLSDYQTDLNSSIGATQIFTTYNNTGPKDISILINEKNPFSTEVELTPDIYFIDRKVQEDSVNVVYELASLLDVEGVKLPGRVLLSKNCPFQYRGEGCLYERKDRLTIKHSGIFGEVIGNVSITHNTGLNGVDETVGGEGSDPSIVMTTGSIVTFTNGVRPDQSILGLSDAPPVADDNDRTFESIKNSAGNNWADKNSWKFNTEYVSGNYIHINKNEINYYFVCIQNHTSDSVNAPPNTKFWISDACSKTLDGCRLRWKENFNFPSTEVQYYSELSDFDQDASAYLPQQDILFLETIKAPKDGNNQQLLGFLPFGGFPSAEGKYRSQQSSSES